MFVLSLDISAFRYCFSFLVIVYLTHALRAAGSTLYGSYYNFNNLRFINIISTTYEFDVLLLYIYIYIEREIDREREREILVLINKLVVVCLKHVYVC